MHEDLEAVLAEDVRLAPAVGREVADAAESGLAVDGEHKGCKNLAFFVVCLTCTRLSGQKNPPIN